MQQKKKEYLLGLIMLFVAGHVLGQIQVKAAGRFSIPSAGGDKSFIGVITITSSVIRIECEKKIFQSFNEFDTPKQAKIEVDMAEVEEIQVQEKMVFIVTKASFWNRYRNISYQVYESRFAGNLDFVDIQKWALLFILDNPAEIKAAEEVLIKIIGERFRAIR